MPLKLVPIRISKPEGDVCKQDVRLKKWPYVRRCGKPAIGTVPIELAEVFHLSYIKICAEHAAELEDHIRKLGTLDQYLTDPPKRES